MKCKTVSLNQFNIHNSCNCAEHNHRSPKEIEKYLKLIKKWDKITTKEKNFIKKYKHGVS